MQIRFPGVQQKIDEESQEFKDIETLMGEIIPICEKHKLHVATVSISSTLAYIVESYCAGDRKKLVDEIYRYLQQSIKNQKEEDAE
jgi:hypothetical protein